MKIIPFEKPVKYCEAYQVFPLPFVIAHYDGEVVRELSDKFICREFFADLAYWNCGGDAYSEVYKFKKPDITPNTLILRGHTYLQENRALFQEAQDLMNIKTEWLDKDVLYLGEGMFDHQFKIGMLTYIIKVLGQKKWDSLKNALDNCTGNELQIKRSFFITSDDLIKAMKVLKKLKKQKFSGMDKDVNISYHIHERGIGFYLSKNFTNEDKMDVTNALQSL